MGNEVGGRGANRRALWAAALLATTAITTTVWTAPAHAQSDAERSFDIPAQPLPSALTLFGRQSGLQVSVPAALADGRTSTAVSGPMSPLQALSRLLIGTGLTYRISGNIVTLEPAPQASGNVISLGAVRVEGNDAKDAQSVLGGNLRGPSDDPVANRVNPQTAVGSKYPVNQRELPQSITVVTRDQIQSQNLNTLSDVINRSPGVTVIRGLPTPLLGSQVYSRGWQITNYNIDGVPTTIDLLPQQNAAMYDRVEVLHGAAGLYGGLGGAGGTVNVVHKQPKDKFSVAGKLSIGSDDTYGAEADVTGPLNEAGTIRARGVAAWQRLGYDNGTFDKGASFYGIIEADIAPQTTVQVGGSYEADSGRPDGGFPNYPDKLYRPSRSHSTFAAPWWHYTNDVTTIFANISHKFDNGWTIKLSGTYESTKALSHNAWANSAIDPVTNTFTVWPSYSPNSRREQGYDVYTDGSLRLFGREHHLTFGANYNKSHSVSDLNEPWDLLQTSFDTAADLPGSDWENTGGGVYEDNQKISSENYGVYANARFSLAELLPVPWTPR